MKNNTTIRLNLWLPLLLFGAFSLLLSFFTFQEYRQDKRDLDESTFTAIRERLARTAGRMGILLNSNLDSLVANDIADYSITAEVRSIVLVNDESVVLHGSKIAWKGRPAQEVLPGFDRVRFLAAQKNHRSDIRLSSSGTELTAYEPVMLSAPSNQIRPSRIGMLYVEYDLSPLMARQWNSLLMHNVVIWFVALGLMLMLWFMLNRWLARPLSHLKNVVHLYSTGDYAARAAISGNGELSELSESFNRMADEVLRNSAKLQAVLDAATEYAIMATDLNGIITVFNPGAERMTGYSAREVIGKQTPMLWHLDSEIRAKSAEYSKALGRPIQGFAVFSEFARQGKVLADNWTVARKNGALLATRVVVTAILDEKEQLTGFLAIAEDITKRKQSEELIANILESVDEGFIILDQNFRILSANKAYARMNALPLEKVVGGHCYEVSHHASSPCYTSGHICVVKKVFETGNPATGVHVHHDAKGGSVHIETKAYPLEKDGAGRVVTVIETLVDITEKKRLEDQLHQSQKMESIGTLAGGIAHDFNNILTAIIGYGHIALMKMAKDDPQRLNIEHMLEAGDRAAHLTQDLLLFSRKQISVQKPVDLNEIVRKVEKFLVRVIGEDIECRTKLSSEPMPVLGDTHQLEQVLMNLATNARDAMPKGGVFTVNTELVRFSEEFLSAHGYGKPGSYVMITLSDTGKGMDELTRVHIFEPFFTTKEMGKGTGLGLAVVYGIIRQHEGFINVYSEPDMGTTFKIFLPLIATNTEKDKALVEAQPIGGTETILLAEDDETVRTLTQTVLEDLGYTVIAAVDGQDAVNKYKEHKDAIRLLLFDLIMPRKTGKEAYDEIRAMTPNVKVLFASGYAPDMVRKKVLIDDEMPVIFKPISPTELLRQVRQVLDEG